MDWASAQDTEDPKADPALDSQHEMTGRTAVWCWH